MARLDAQRLLAVWEANWRQTPVEKAVALAAAAYPQFSRDEIASLPVGARDGLLLSLRMHLFGEQATAVTNCPTCNEPSEFSLKIPDILVDPPTLAAITFSWKGRECQFRLPNSDDLQVVAFSQSDDRRRSLVELCLVGEAKEEVALSEELVSAVSESMEEHDPQANVVFFIACAACGHEWETCFDIVTFLWSELHIWAQRTLVEIHTLAHHYGWSEHDILNMHGERRQIYLNMIEA